MKVLLGVTGGVASKLTSKLVSKLLQADHEVKVVVTGSVKYFWENHDENLEVYTDKDEWMGEKYIQDSPIAHIELGKWADVLLVCPLTANTLAKIANGLADNLLTCIVRAWDTGKPIVVAPAMNTKMWVHPVTSEHLQKLKGWFPFKVVSPISKKLACGDTGIGALANLDDIVSVVNKLS